MVCCGPPRVDSIFAPFLVGNRTVLKCFSCREWWYFALNANLHEIREQRTRCTWDFLLHRARDAVSYTDKYFTKLKGGLLSADDTVRGCCLVSRQRIRISLKGRRKWTP